MPRVLFFFQNNAPFVDCSWRSLQNASLVIAIGADTAKTGPSDTWTSAGWYLPTSPLHPSPDQIEQLRASRAPAMELGWPRLYGAKRTAEVTYDGTHQNHQNL